MRDFVAYVAKDVDHGRACFVLQCNGSQAQDVISIIGKAFEARFQEIIRNKDLQKMPSSLSSTLSRQRKTSSSDTDYYNDLPGEIPVKHVCRKRAALSSSILLFILHSTDKVPPEVTSAVSQVSLLFPVLFPRIE